MPSRCAAASTLILSSRGAAPRSRTVPDNDQRGRGGRSGPQASPVSAPGRPQTPGSADNQRKCGLMLSRIAAELGTTTYTVEHKLRRLRSQRPAQATAARCPLKLFDLRPQHCRWIVVGSGEGALFCGKPKVGTSPYCAEHTQQAWQNDILLEF
jgi:hypothetical protein